MANQKLEFTGEVTQEGELLVPRWFKENIQKAFAGKEIVLTVTRKAKFRSLNQNAYYWAVVIQMIYEAMNEQGENVDPKTVHEFLKLRFLKFQKIDHDTGEVIYEFGRSTSGLFTFEFAFYLENCFDFAKVYFGITIPAPNTQKDVYSFPEYQSKEESRPDYLERIAGYLERITTRMDLKRYFRFIPEWDHEQDVKAVFRKRHDAILE